ncbi:MAG: FlgD immunoglobulin-like domain containing protein [bacterium]
MNYVTRIVCILACLAGAVSSTWAYLATVNKTDYQEIHIVPAPGKVVIDGDLKDWDLSGSVDLFLDEASRATMNVEGAYMYDEEAFYVGGRVKDPTPMMNAHDFASDMGLVWDSDCIQLYLIADPAVKSKVSTQSGGQNQMSAADQQSLCYIFLWYSTRDQKPGFMIMYTLGFKDMALNPKEVEAVYKKDADGKGYTFEYRIPWKILRQDKPWKDGDKVQTQWQVQWGDPLGEKGIAGMSDVRMRDSTDLSYMGPASWGTGIVHGKGNLKLTKKEKIGRAEGHILIEFELAQATKVSLAVTDKDGHIIRTCLGAAPMEAGKQTYLWDGLDDYDRPVPGGEYRWRMLTQEGFEQKYVCDVGVSGNPPYQNDAGTGGWAGDYGWPVCVDVDGDQVVLGTGDGEAAHKTIGTTLDGQKQWGGYWGAKGFWALKNGCGYFTDWEGRLTRFNVREGKLKAFADGRSQIQMTSGGKPVNTGAGGMTEVDGKLAVVSMADQALYLVDAETGAVKEKLPLEGAGWGAATGPKGELYVVAGDRIGRYDLLNRKFQSLTDPLPEHRMLTCDAAGNLYACVWGSAMQVWKFSPDGKLVQKIGKEGGRPVVGKFDPNGMYRPYDVAVDKNGRIWVAEFDDMPKRYSVWNADGTLWKEFLGSLAYSSGAYLDPTRPEEFYVMPNMRYKLDYDKGTWAMDRTMSRGIKWELPVATADAKPLVFDFPLAAGKSGNGAIFANVKGRQFVGFGGSILEIVNDAYVPRFYAARPYSTPRNWRDDNNDGRLQPEEVSTPQGFTTTDSHLNLYRLLRPMGHHQSSGGLPPKPLKPADKPFPVVERVKFTGFNANGGLTWAFDKPEVVATDTYEGVVPDAAIAVDDEGRILVLYATGDIQRGQRAQGTGHRVVCYDGKGGKLWEYHNVHVAFAWTSDPYSPGFITGALETMATSSKRLWGVTGYYGQYFLLDKETGLFVAALGQDQRSAHPLDHTTVLTENFNGTIWTHLRNGKTYFSGGDADCRIWELKGYEDYKIREGKVQVNAAQVVQAGKNAEQARLAEQSAMGMLRQFKLRKLANAAADGNYGEWATVQPQTVLMADKRMAQAQLGYDEKYLWIRFQVADESPLRNQASDYRHLFKTGDALDIQFCTDTGVRPEHGQNQQEMRLGDARILVVRTKEDKMNAAIIRYCTPGADKPRQYEYVSSVWKEKVDEVSEINDLPMHCKAEKDNYVVEVGVPWSVIGLKPAPGLKFKGDVGVIYGNEGGTINAVRYLWSDKTPATGVNNDVPTEMRMHPNDLGMWIVAPTD